MNFNEFGARGAWSGVAEQQAVVAAVVLQGFLADLAARVWKNPWIVGGVLELAAEAKVGFWNVGFGVLGSAFGAVPEGGGGGSGGREGEARGGACGGEIGRLAGPALDADEVEDGEAEGGA